MCEPKTADINKLGWRPNTDADQHYVESGLLPPWDRNAAVRKRIQQGLCGYAEPVITMKTWYKRKYTKKKTENIVTSIVRINYL